jgi:hypothetical protein
LIVLPLRVEQEEPKADGGGLLADMDNCLMNILVSLHLPVIERVMVAARRLRRSICNDYARLQDIYDLAISNH